ncbi:MAG: YkgJ family cysteine cluster protein [Planctomycetota bacterium]
MTEFGDDADRNSGETETGHKTPWYRDGLHFECTQCGDCCSGAPGYVYVDDDEIAALALAMEMPVDAFERQFVRRVGVRRSLTEYPDGDCIFLDPDSRHCIVYAARPIQCRTWPFWNQTLRSPTTWAQTCDVCPGCSLPGNERGVVTQLPVIESRRKQRAV